MGTLGGGQDEVLAPSVQEILSTTCSSINMAYLH